jgi:hypothetical protein
VTKRPGSRKSLAQIRESLEKGGRRVTRIDIDAIRQIIDEEEERIRGWKAPGKQCRYCQHEFFSSDLRRVYCSSQCSDQMRKGSRGPSFLAGSVAELFVATYLMTRGYYVFRALSPTGPFDLVAFKNGKTLKIEVKTGTSPDSVPKHRHAAHDTLAVVYRGGVRFYGEHPDEEPENE